MWLTQLCRNEVWLTQLCRPEVWRRAGSRQTGETDVCQMSCMSSVSPSRSRCDTARPHTQHREYREVVYPAPCGGVPPLQPSLRALRLYPQQETSPACVQGESQVTGEKSKLGIINVQMCCIGSAFFHPQQCVQLTAFDRLVSCVARSRNVRDPHLWESLLPKYSWKLEIIDHPRPQSNSPLPPSLGRMHQPS